jgi:hypothetical protein
MNRRLEAALTAFSIRRSAPLPVSEIGIVSLRLEIS